MNEIDQYIARFPLDVRFKLSQIRKLIRSLAPEAIEVMKYGIPTFTLGKNLVHFAGYKNHIGFYPTPSVIKAFESVLHEYKQSKGTVQFPVEDPLPLDLIEEMVLFRINEIKGLKK